MKRILIFSHYNKSNNLSKYILYWLDNLKPLFEKVIFVSNSKLSKYNEDKIKKYANKIIIRNNIGYDFAAWRDAILQQGFEELGKYDSLTLMNDTCFGPLYDMSEFYNKMEEAYVDFWGNTNHKKCQIAEFGPHFKIQEHIQSYFIVFNQDVVKSKVFQDFWRNVGEEKDVLSVIKKYEVQLTYKLLKAGFKYKTLIDTTQKKYNNKHFNVAHVYPLVMLEEKSPFLKIKNFVELPHLSMEIKNAIRDKTSYPVNLIEEHIRDVYGCLEENKTLLKLKHLLYSILKFCYNLLPNFIKNIKLINKIKEKIICNDGYKKSIHIERYAILNRINFSVNTNDGRRRISLITDSINKGSLFGGVATSIIFAGLWARKTKADLRLITRTEAADVEDVVCILKSNDIVLKTNIETIFCPSHSTKRFDILEKEIFITTSWWTTQVIINSGQENRIFYLLQEDERMFYPLGDDYLMALNIMKNKNIRFIVNSFLLYEHLIVEGFNNIKENGLYFEPGVNSKYYYCKGLKDKEKYDFFFYARPNHLRNAFYFGMELIKLAIQRGILDPEKWRFNYVGANIPHNMMLKNIDYKIYDTLSLSDYAKLVRNVDLALSLMLSPHTSYPPLDIASSGGVVVTNKWGVKKDLKMYSKNIICADIESDAMLNALQQGVQLALNKNERWRNFKDNKIPTSWEEAFKDILSKI